MNNEILARAKEAKRALQGGFLSGAGMLIDAIVEIAEREKLMEEIRRVDMLKRIEAVTNNLPQFLQKHAD